MIFLFFPMQSSGINRSHEIAICYEITPCLVKNGGLFTTFSYFLVKKDSICGFS